MSRAADTARDRGADAGTDPDDTAAPRPLTDRERRALTERLVVLPPRLAPRQDARSGLFSVTGESGASYVVDPVLGSCTCPDATYNAPDGKCKHVVRVRAEVGVADLPAWVDADDAPQFRRFVDARSPEGDER